MIGLRRDSFCAALLTLVCIGCPPPDTRESANSDAGAEDASDTTAAVMTPPSPYAVPAEGAPNCELSADCPAGTYCDLGQCFQACNTVDPCADGLVCLQRGRCAMSADEPSDPPQNAEGVALQAPSTIYVPRGQRITSVHVEANTDAVIRFRAEPKASWMHVSQTRGEFTRSLDLEVSVDAQGLDASSGTAPLLLYTSHGLLTVVLCVEADLSGVYQGELAYETPRAIGRVPLRVEIAEAENGYLKMRVDPLYSPTFRVASAAPLAFGGELDGSQISVRAIQVIKGLDLGVNRYAEKDLGRVLSLSLERAAGGGLNGTFTESWRGIFLRDVEVEGSVHLARVFGAEGTSFVVPANTPELPQPASVNPIELGPTCNVQGRSCTRGSSTLDLVDCGNAFLAAGYRLDAGRKDDGEHLLVPVVSKDPSGAEITTYQDAVAQCGAEIQANVAANAAEQVTCVRPSLLDCAEAAFGLAHTKGDVDGTAGLSRVASARAGLGLLLVNEGMVQVYELPYRSADSAIEGQVLALLDAAHAMGAAHLKRVLAPFPLAALKTLPRAVARRDDYRGLRRAAQLLARDRLALESATSIQMRSPQVSLDTLRRTLDQDALNLLVGAIALSALEAAQEAPATPELGLLSGALTGLTAKSLGIQEAIDGKRDVDPLGEPDGFVAFMYDPLRTIEGVTNYEQVLAAGAPVLAAATAAETQAVAAIATVAESQDALGRQLTELAASMNQQLGDLCGFLADRPSEPDLDHCGENGGALLEAQNSYKLGLEGIHLAEARIEGLATRVQIQTKRVADIQQVREDTIAFVGSSNQKINAISIQQSEIDAAREFLSVAANASLLNGGAPIALAAASTLLTVARSQLELRKDELRQAQELRMLEDGAQVEVIDGMAALKDLLVGMAELNVELTMAGISAAGDAQRVANLKQKQSALIAERDLLLESTLDQRANDPAFRVLRDKAINDAITTREAALLWVYRAARAFELEINTSFPPIRDSLVPALRASDIQKFVTCIDSSHGKFRVAYGAPTTFVDEVSLRRDVLGIQGPITDEVTGEILSEADQFRQLLLQPSSLGADGTVGLKFVMSLDPDNGVWSSGICNDLLRTIQVKLVGDNLGDAQATIRMQHAGTAFVRSCDSGRAGRGDVVNAYAVWTGDANELGAGVNSYPEQAPRDAQFFGRPVAASEWSIALPSGKYAPRNADLHPENIEDIILRIEHGATSLGDGPVSFSPACDF